MKTFIVKYVFAGRKYAVRVCAADYDRAVNTVSTMTSGRVYSVREAMT